MSHLQIKATTDRVGLNSLVEEEGKTNYTNGQHFIFDCKRDLGASQVFHSCSDIWTHAAICFCMKVHTTLQLQPHADNILTKWLNYLGTLHTMAPEFSSLLFFTGEPTLVPLLVATILPLMMLCELPPARRVLSMRRPD